MLMWLLNNNKIFYLAFLKCQICISIFRKSHLIIFFLNLKKSLKLNLIKIIYLFIYFHNVVHILQLVLRVLHKPNPATKNSNPSQEHKPSNQDLKPIIRTQTQQPRTQITRTQTKNSPITRTRTQQPRTQITITLTQLPKTQTHIRRTHMPAPTPAVSLSSPNPYTKPNPIKNPKATPGSSSPTTRLIPNWSSPSSSPTHQLAPNLNPSPKSSSALNRSLSPWSAKTLPRLSRWSPQRGQPSSKNSA